MASDRSRDKISDIESSQLRAKHKSLEPCNTMISGAGLDQRVATSTELSTVDSRQRIDSLSKQPQARPPSIFDDTEKYDFSRAESIGSRGARPASIIEEQESSQQKASVSTVAGTDVHSPKRRQKATIAGRDTDGKATCFTSDSKKQCNESDPVKGKVATDTGSNTAEVRERIDSFNTQPQARPPSIHDECNTGSYDINRTWSTGAHGARPASIIEEQGNDQQLKPSISGTANSTDMHQAYSPSPKRRQRATVAQVPGKDADAQTSVISTVTDIKNKSPLKVESSIAELVDKKTADECVQVNNKTVASDHNPIQQLERSQCESSSDSESMSRSTGSSISSYEADPQFSSFHTEASNPNDHQSQCSLANP